MKADQLQSEITQALLDRDDKGLHAVLDKYIQESICYSVLKVLTLIA